MKTFLKWSSKFWLFNCEKIVVFYYGKFSIHYWKSSSITNLRCLLLSIIHDKTTWWITARITKGVMTIFNSSFCGFVCHGYFKIVEFNSTHICLIVYIISKPNWKHIKFPIMNGDECLVPLHDKLHVTKYLGRWTT